MNTRNFTSVILKRALLKTTSFHPLSARNELHLTNAFTCIKPNEKSNFAA